MLGITIVGNALRLRADALCGAVDPIVAKILAPDRQRDQLAMGVGSFAGSVYDPCASRLRSVAAREPFHGVCQPCD